MFQRLSESVDHFLFQQKDRLVLWIPTFLTFGIISYFSLPQPFENFFFYILIVVLILIGSLLYFAPYLKLKIFGLGLFFILLGIGCSHWRTLRVHTPMLSHPISEPTWVKGTIEEVSQGIRHKKITLNVHKIQNIEKNLPKKIQLIYRAKKEKDLNPGDYIVLKAKLDPLQGPIVPEGYNFKQQAFYKQIGAQGYIIYIHKVKPAHIPRLLHIINKYRLQLTQKFLQVLSHQEGAIAAALVTGDTSGLSKETRDSFSDSGTAHILAISGLHLSLIGGLLFFLTRLLIGFFPFVILRIPAKKIAAVLALIGAFVYLYLSGCRVPTQRAFISFSFMMIAILLDRNPISLRLVALAATLILLISPEVLFTPSFQLSFAAVTGLIAFYESIQVPFHNKTLAKKISIYLLGILISSVVASFATLPFTLHHFYKFTLQSIGSNMLMIPLLGLWVMPTCLCFIGVLWWPFGQQICGMVLKKGIEFMITIAHTFSHLPGSLIYVPEFSKVSFSLTVVGGLIISLLKGPIRWSGGGLILVGILYTWIFPKKIPTIFIAQGGKTIGIVHKNHLFLSSPRVDTFLARVWAGYAGIPPTHIHKLKQKKPHLLTSSIIFYEKNFLIDTGKIKIGYLKNKEGLEFTEEATILIAPSLDLEKKTFSFPPYNPMFLLDKRWFQKNSRSVFFYQEKNNLSYKFT